MNLYAVIALNRTSREKKVFSEQNFADAPSQLPNVCGRSGKISPNYEVVEISVQGVDRLRSNAELELAGFKDRRTYEAKLFVANLRSSTRAP